VLDYIDNETLRRHIQRALNRGEAFHQLRRVIAETNGKKFRGSHHAELTLWNEYARLIANYVIHYNAQVLSGIKEQ
jgi:TnpA family transposase